METFKMFIPERKLMLHLHALGTATFSESKTNPSTNLLLDCIIAMLKSLWNEDEIEDGFKNLDEINLRFTDDHGITDYTEVVKYIETMQDTEATVEVDREIFGIEWMSIFYIANNINMSENILIYISKIMQKYFSIEELKEFDDKVHEIMSVRRGKQLKRINIGRYLN